MAVPETTLHKNDFAMLGQNDVRSAGKILAVKPEPVAEPVQDGAHGQFRLCVFTAYSAHEGRTLSCRDRVHIAFSWGLASKNAPMLLHCTPTQ